MAVAVSALAAIGLAALASRLIKRRSDSHLEPAGTGDEPGSADRGPDGQRM